MRREEVDVRGGGCKRRWQGKDTRNEASDDSERTIALSCRVRRILSYSHRDYDVLFSTIRIPEMAAPSSLAAVFRFAHDGLGSRIALVDANRKLGDVWTVYHTSTCMEASDPFACVMVSLPA
jgi:hypothetical protein